MLKVYLFRTIPGEIFGFNPLFLDYMDHKYLEELSGEMRLAIMRIQYFIAAYLRNEAMKDKTSVFHPDIVHDAEVDSKVSGSYTSLGEQGRSVFVGCVVCK
ncbi:unnamed protein product [Arabis nemorensis]|uniref:Uncharacterized protein n=1 Tax=Arabis nemorensis TaxID=586526 RepID=A0A565BV39_9BRAS|nr:unnamed protein product [Arabis nemorensis]